MLGHLGTILGHLGAYVGPAWDMASLVGIKWLGKMVLVFAALFLSQIGYQLLRREG